MKLEKKLIDNMKVKNNLNYFNLSIYIIALSK